MNNFRNNPHLRIRNQQQEPPKNCCMKFMMMFLQRFYEIVSFVLFISLTVLAFKTNEGPYWIFISVVEDKFSLAIVINFIGICLYKTLMFWFTIFFERILEMERIELSDRIRIRLIFISFTLIIFYLSKDEITFIIYVTTVITLWSIIWLTTLRSAFQASKPKKDWTKITKIIILYVFLIAMLQVLIKVCYHFDTLTSKLFLYEIYMMIIEAVLHLLTFIIEITEVFKSEDDNTKFFLSEMIKLILQTIKICVQVYYLIKFIITHLLPLFWLRDLIVSSMETCRLVSNILKGINLTLKIHYLPTIDLGEDSKEICAVCIDTIVKGKKLSCGHIFHETCLIKLIQRADDKKCPQCRLPIILKSQPSNESLTEFKSKLESSAVLVKCKDIQDSLKLYQIDLKLKIFLKLDNSNNQWLINALNEEDTLNQNNLESNISGMVDALKLSCLSKNLDSEIITKKFDIFTLKKYTVKDVNYNFLKFCSITNFPYASNQIFWKQIPNKNINALPQVYTGGDNGDRREVHKNRLFFISDLLEFHSLMIKDNNK